MVVSIFMFLLVLSATVTESQSCAPTGGGGNPSVPCGAAAPTIVAADAGNSIRDFNPMDGQLSADGNTLTFTCDSLGQFAQIDDNVMPVPLTYVDSQQIGQNPDPNAPAVLTLNCAGTQWTFTANGATLPVTQVRCIAGA